MNYPGKIPKVYDNMVHGTGMLYPGVMALLKFSKKNRKE